MEVPAEKRRKGCLAGVKHRERNSRYKPCLLVIVMGNIRALSNKMDDLMALTRLQREYRACSIMCFSCEFHADIPDRVVSLNSFTLLQADRKKAESSKRKDKSLAVFVNNRWGNLGHITVKEQLCSGDIELLAVSIQPYYLPCKLSHVIMMAVYILPCADSAAATGTVHSTDQAPTSPHHHLWRFQSCLALCHSPQLHTIH